MYDLVIIGSGPAGPSAVAYLKRGSSTGCGCFRERADGWRTDDLYAGS